MPRIRPVDPEATSDRAKEVLRAVQEEFGMIPNLLKSMASSPAVAEAYLGFSAALGLGLLPASLRERIALAVAEVNASEYCLAAHAALGKLTGLSDEDILDSRRATSPNRKVEAALRFARKLVTERGHVSDEDVARLRRVGYGDGEIAEIVANVALNIFTNYFNHAAGTEVEFPEVPPLERETA